MPAQDLIFTRFGDFPVLVWFAPNETKSVTYGGSENIESIRTFIETKLGIVPTKVSF